MSKALSTRIQREELKRFPISQTRPAAWVRSIFILIQHQDQARFMSVCMRTMAATTRELCWGRETHRVRWQEAGTQFRLHPAASLRAPAIGSRYWARKRQARTSATGKLRFATAKPRRKAISPCCLRRGRRERRGARVISRRTACRPRAVRRFSQFLPQL